MALAERLDLDLDATGICLACLSFVSMELDAGNKRKARGQARRLAPVLWAEGLEAPLRLALERARAAGDEDADEAIGDLELAGARAKVLPAVVYRLGQELSERARAARVRGEPVLPVFGFTPWPPTDVHIKGGDV